MTGTYLDTSVAVWLAQGTSGRLTPKARNHIESAELLLSPIVLLELEYLYEIKKLLLPARELQRKLSHELGVQVCDFELPKIADFALNEIWTRDPFDRMIVAHAKASGFAWLVSSDEEIAQHYPRTVW